MRSINEIRRQKLLQLVTEAGSIKSVADCAGRNADYLSQILSPVTKRNMGDGLARSLEQGFNKPKFWMDSHDGEMDLSFDDLSEEQRQILRSLLQSWTPKPRT